MYIIAEPKTPIATAAAIEINLTPPRSDAKAVSTTPAVKPITDSIIVFKVSMI